MILEAYDKFEYKYVKLSTSIKSSVDDLNSYGNEGWEIVKFFEPRNALVGDTFAALLKRKITRTEV